MGQQIEERDARRALHAALVAAGGACLVAGPPGPAWRQVTSARSWSEPVAALPGLDAVVAAGAVLALWGLALLLLLIVLLVDGAALPGRAGHLLGRAAVRLAPPPARRLVAVAAGVALVVGGAGPAAAASPSATTSDAVATAPAVVLPDGAAVVLDHPWTEQVPGPGTGSASGVPSATPAATPSGSAAANAPPAPAPPPVASIPAPVAPSAARPSTATSPEPRTTAAATDPGPERAGGSAVVVAPGDSLWSIAREQLAAQQPGTAVPDARVAQAWPGWWAANREAVGDDPDLLLPGTRLVPPPG